MCLAIPARVVELLPAEQARVDIAGIGKTISLALVDDVAVGDYVIVHVGFALSKLSEEEAKATLALFAEAGMLEDAMAELHADGTAGGESVP
jgi:hydrogenase expression/formation protein HypC